MHKQYFFSKGLWKQNDTVVVAALMYVLNHRLDHNNYTTHLAKEQSAVQQLNKPHHTVASMTV